MESALVLAAQLSVIVLWAEEGRGEAAARSLVVTILFVGTLQAAFGVVQVSVAPGGIYGLISPDIASPYGSFPSADIVTIGNSATSRKEFRLVVSAPGAR